MFKNLFIYKSFSKLLVQLLVVLVLGGTLLAASCDVQQNKTQTQKPDSSTISIDLASRESTSQFRIGVTRTHIDQGPMTTAGHRLIGQAVSIQNVFIYGWGTDNPEPSKGQYDFTSLDQRVSDIQSSGSQAIISLCCSPDWMKTTNNIEDAPLTQNYQAFAQLAALIAARYKSVKMFQVWNELKGFNDDYRAYTTFYNDVYDAVKAVRPDAELGGPYLGVLPGVPVENQAVYNYWLKNKHGGNYILFDGGPLLGTQPDEFNSTFFSDWIHWVRKQPDGGATMPVAWSEFFTRGLQDTTSLAAAHYNATFADDTISNIKLGVSYALMWGASSPDGVTDDPNIPETMMKDNGQPTPIFYTMKAFKDYFGPGTQLYATKVYSTNVTALASRTKTMLVNHLPTAQTFKVNGTTVNLAPYQVLVINTPA